MLPSASVQLPSAPLVSVTETVEDVVELVSVLVETGKVTSKLVTIPIDSVGTPTVTVVAAVFTSLIVGVVARTVGV